MWEKHFAESHQQEKKDTSGTAKAMVQYFKELGIPFTVDQIFGERDPLKQEVSWGVPAQYLKGHGYHTYSLLSGDGTVSFSSPTMLTDEASIRRESWMPFVSWPSIRKTREKSSL